MERWVASDSFVYAAVRVEAFCSLLLLKWRPAAAANTNISKYFIFEPCKNFCTVSPPAGRVERVSPLISDMLNLGGWGGRKAGAQEVVLQAFRFVLFSTCFTKDEKS